MNRILHLVLNLYSVPFLAQVTFSSIPLDMQLVPRDLVTNRGIITVAGTVNIASPYQAIKLKIYRDTTLIDTVRQNLSFSGNVAFFSMQYGIPAELAEYDIAICGIISGSGREALVDSVVDIVAGDAYIIQGQSNAEAKSYWGSANGNQSRFIRVFGSGTSNPSGPIYDRQWYIGQGDGTNNSSGNTGQWGLKLARMLVDSFQVPIAIFNGAHGGRQISFFQAPFDYATSLNSNYGRLYYRLKTAGVKDYVRAIFWSQGESDGAAGATMAYYKSAFLTLRDSWRHDYPGVEKIYIFQTKNGCGDPLHQIKEAQRQIAAEKEDVHIMSTAACIQYTDNCHFQYDHGYETFAERIFWVVARDLYGYATAREVEPPMITSAYLLDDTNLVVETDADTLMTATFPDDFRLENAGTAAIDSIYLMDNKIIFNLSAHPGDSASISYLAQPAGSPGNFVTNSSGLELVCFNKVRITRQPSVHLSGTVHTELGTPIPGATITLSGSDNQQVITGYDGQYSFTVAKGGTYNIAVSKSDDAAHENDITVLDLLLTQRHVLGIKLLDSPYKIIAADGNASGMITTNDVALGALIVLGAAASYPNNKVWEFVSSDYSFAGTGTPFFFEKTRTYSSLNSSLSNQNFIGVKMGDVNNSWDARMR